MTERPCRPVSASADNAPPSRALKQEGTSAHTCPSGADKAEVSERVGTLLDEVASAHRTLAGVFAELAGLLGNGLAGSPDPRLMVDVNAITEPSPPLLTVADLAQLMQVGERTVRRWRAARKLPSAIVVGGVARWRSEAIEAWLAEREEADR